MIIAPDYVKCVTIEHGMSNFHEQLEYIIHFLECGAQQLRELANKDKFEECAELIKKLDMGVYLRHPAARFKTLYTCGLESIFDTDEITQAILMLDYPKCSRVLSKSIDELPTSKLLEDTYKIVGQRIIYAALRQELKVRVPIHDAKNINRYLLPAGLEINEKDHYVYSLPDRQFFAKSISECNLNFRFTLEPDLEYNKLVEYVWHDHEMEIARLEGIGEDSPEPIEYCLKKGQTAIDLSETKFVTNFIINANIWTIAKMNQMTALYGHNQFYFFINKSENYVETGFKSKRIEKIFSLSMIYTGKHAMIHETILDDNENLISSKLLNAKIVRLE